MKAIPTDHSINFVDKNNVVVGFTTEQHCCELCEYGLADVSLGWDEELEDVDLVNEDDWVFDPDFFESDTQDETARASFRLTNGSEIMYLILSNTHNGYYAHGFTMKIDEKMKQEGFL